MSSSNSTLPSDNGAPATGNGAPVAFNGAPSAVDGAPVAFNGAPAAGDGVLAAGDGGLAAVDGAPAAGTGAPAAGNGGPAVGNGGPAAGTGAPAAGDGAPTAGNGAPAASSSARKRRVAKNTSGVRRQRRSECEVPYNKEELRPLFLCSICGNLLRKTTTVKVCIDRFCWECIFKKLGEEGQKECPQCKINLGENPLSTLRCDPNYQIMLECIFPPEEVVGSAIPNGGDHDQMQAIDEAKQTPKGDLQ